MANDIPRGYMVCRYCASWCTDPRDGDADRGVCAVDVMLNGLAGNEAAWTNGDDPCSPDDGFVPLESLYQTVRDDYEAEQELQRDFLHEEALAGGYA